VPEAEVFAEQFAFWAAGDRSVRTSYDLPPLVSRSAFGRLMAQVRQSARSLLAR
jgi:hypothetical protein